MVLTFDLLTPTVDCFVACLVDYLCQFAAQLIHSFSNFLALTFGNGRMNERTEGRTSGRRRYVSKLAGQKDKKDKALMQNLDLYRCTKRNLELLFI